MDRFIPTPEGGRMTDEEWGLALQAQFDNTVPATKRQDLLQKWVQQYVGQYTFDSNDKTPGITWLDPDYLEEKLPEDMQEGYAAMKSRIAYLFGKNYGIVFNDDEVDFRTMYWAYLFFVQNSPRTFARYIRAFYESHIKDEHKDVSVSKFFSDITENEVKEQPSILFQDSDDTSIDYSTVALVLNGTILEDFVDTVLLASDGNELVDFVAAKVLFTCEIASSDGENVFTKRIYNEIQDPEVVGAVLRELETV